MNRKWLILCFILMLRPVLSFAYDPGSPESYSLGRALSLSSSDAATLLTVPTGSLAPGKWRIEAGYSRRFNLADLDQSFVVGAYRTGRFTLGAGLSQFGDIDLYAERVLKGSFAFHYDSLSIGLTLSGMMVDFGGNYGQLRASTIGGGLSYRSNRFFVAFSADNVTSPQLYPGAIPELPVYDLYFQLIGQGKFSLLTRITAQKEQDTRLGLGQKIDLSKTVTLNLGISSKPLTYGGGLRMKFSSISILYSASVHPVLGLTQSLSFGYGSDTRIVKGDGFDQ